jgi:hypothetical protein
MFYSAEELARYGLRRLASKVGDEAVFTQSEVQPLTIEHNPYYGTELTAET